MSKRWPALLWLLLREDELKKSVFPELVDLASVGHSDIALVRTVIQSMPRQWVIERIQEIAQSVLDRQAALGANDRYEEFRRFAELFVDLDKSLLPPLVERALADPDPHVREVGQDYRRYI